MNGRFLERRSGRTVAGTIGGGGSGRFRVVGLGGTMTKYRIPVRFMKHMPDCEFGFAPADVCGCVQERMMAEIKKKDRKIKELQATLQRMRREAHGK